jgi:hypothetical protein
MIDKSYLVWGPSGIEEVLCLRCGNTVRIIAAGTLTSRDGRKFDVNKLMDLPNYRSGPRIKINTINGESHINPIICSDCEGKEIDPEEVLKQYKDQWLKSAITEEDISKINAITLG